MVQFWLGYSGRKKPHFSCKIGDRNKLFSTFDRHTSAGESFRGPTIEAGPIKMSSRAVRKALKRLEAQKELEKGIAKDTEREEEEQDEVLEEVSLGLVNPFAMVCPPTKQALIIVK